MTITAKIIADSLSTDGIRLSTIQLRYPKFIHGEVLTHRDFSRSSSSSRAIPVERLLEDILRDPVNPSFWGKNQAGMQANEELDPYVKDYAIYVWNLARESAIAAARGLSSIGAHKQIVNRIIEPFSHINTLVTATEWQNFYELRRHSAAQPEIHELADRMYEAQQASEPEFLKTGEWHLPYVLADELPEYNTDILKKISVARCARVSYLTHEAKPPSIADDLKLFERLVGSVPLHASPAEHQATPDLIVGNEGFGGAWSREPLHRNFNGWIQYRALLDSLIS